MTTAQLIYATIATIGLCLGWRACFGWFKWWLAPIFVGAAIWSAVLPAAAQDALTGRVAHVRDGDTIVIGPSTPVRLQGVHAPELDEPGGYEAQRFMAQLVTGERVECRLTGGWRSQWVSKKAVGEIGSISRPQWVSIERVPS